MSYDLSIVPKDSKSVIRRAQVESYIESLPHVQRGNDGVFDYGKPSRRMIVQIYVEQTETIGSIGVTVPAAGTKSSCEAALLLSFKIAEHLGWKVFDQQLGDFLDKNTASEVLQSQKKFGDTQDEVLKRRASGEATFGEVFAEKIYEHKALVIIPTLVIAAVIAGWILIKRGMAEDKFVWLFMGAAAVLLCVRAVIATLWHRAKKRP